MRRIPNLIWVSIIVFAGIFSWICCHGTQEACFDVDSRKICYFEPDGNFKKWDDAWKLCKKLNSTLPVIESQIHQGNLEEFLKSRKSTADIWLAGRDIRETSWHWSNGRKLSDQYSVKLEGEAVYNTQAVLKGSINHNNLSFVSAYPDHGRGYICQYHGDTCQTNNSTRYMNRCIVVYDNKDLTLVEARNKCFENKGELATFEDGFPNVNAGLLKNDRGYWIELRRNWWIWNKTDSSHEIIYSNWQKYENLPRHECLILERAQFKWHQTSCNDIKYTICQRVSGENTPTTQNQLPIDSTTKSDADFPIGLVIGVILAAVGAIAAIVIVLIALTLLKRKPRESNYVDKEQPVPSREESRSVEQKRVEEKADALGGTSCVYAEIPMAAKNKETEQSRDGPQTGVLYASLDFDGKCSKTESARGEAQDPATSPTVSQNSRLEIVTGKPSEATIYGNIG